MSDPGTSPRMLASREMRAIRELSLAAPLALVGLRIFFGGGPGNASLPWLGRRRAR